MNVFGCNEDDYDFILYAIPRSGSTVTNLIIKELLKLSDKNLNFTTTHHFIGSHRVVDKLIETERQIVQPGGNYTLVGFMKMMRVFEENQHTQDTPVIICLRDVFDCWVSYHNAIQNWIQDGKKNNYKVSKESVDIKTWFHTRVFIINLYYLQMLRGRTTYVLRYEDFNTEEGMLKRVTQLSKILNINVSIKTLKDISEKLSIDNNKKLIKELPHFGVWDEKTMLHGDHIGTFNGASGASDYVFDNETKMNLFFQNAYMARCLLGFGYNYTGPIFPRETREIKKNKKKL